MTDVTPEMLQRILDHPDCPESVRQPLAAWSMQLLPVEMWAQVLHDAAAPIDGAWVDYEDAPENMKATARRQARAVIKALPEQLKFDKGGEELGQPSPMCQALIPGGRYLCTRPLDHDDRHQSWRDGKLIATWGKSEDLA